MKRSLCRALVVAAVAYAGAACSRPSLSEPEGARRTKAELHRMAGARVEAGELARADGWVYAVDVGLLLIFAAREGDESMYRTLRGFALEHLVLHDSEDPYTDGFVAWRYREGAQPDASGTTEALRVAEGLWIGSQRFGDDADRDHTLRILDGYARHAAVEGGVWMIRNYFNLGTRAYATNSFLVDYAPDFVADVAEATGRTDLREIAEKSYDLIDQARTPTGLLYDIVQPEVATLFDEGVVIFSPNDRIQLSNAATVAVCAVRGLPGVARDLVSFSHERMPGLRGTYYGRTGEVAWDKRPGIEAWASLVRLAVALEEREALEAFYPFLVSNAGRNWRIPSDAWLYVAAELLLGLQAVVPADTPVS